MKLSPSTIEYLAEMICGGSGSSLGFNWENFPYRTSSYLTRFFTACDLPYVHDGSTRGRWVAGVLTELNQASPLETHLPSPQLIRVIQELVNAHELELKGLDQSSAVSDLNRILARDSLEVRCEHGDCYVVNTAVRDYPAVRPDRRFSTAQHIRRASFERILSYASEDELTVHILVPLFNHLGFTGIRVAGHRDKSLEYGKDISMKLSIPTGHTLYFGVQVKKERIHSAGSSSSGNIATVISQIEMMLRHDVFDSETNSKHLVDHVFLVSSGEITKAARNLLSEHLTRHSRRQILFLDREEILDHCALANIPIPNQQ